MTKNAANAHRFDRIRVNGINVGWTLTPAEQVMQAETLGLGPGWAERAAATPSLRAPARAAGDREPRRLPRQRRLRPDDRRADRPGAMGAGIARVTPPGAPRPGARSTGCRPPSRAPPTTAPRSRPAWRTSASAPSTAAHQAEFTDDLLGRRVRPLGHRRDQRPPAPPRRHARRPGRPLHPPHPRRRPRRGARRRQHRRGRRQPGTTRPPPSPCSPRPRSTSSP